MDMPAFGSGPVSIDDEYDLDFYGTAIVVSHRHLQVVSPRHRVDVSLLICDCERESPAIRMSLGRGGRGVSPFPGECEIVRARVWHNRDGG